MHDKEQFAMAHWPDKPWKYWDEFEAAVFDLRTVSHCELVCDQKMY